MPEIKNPMTALATRWETKRPKIRLDFLRDW